MSGEFRPAPWLPGAHLQTILPAFWPAGSMAGGERILVPVSDDSRVRVDIDRPARTSRGTLLLLHGMCGSSESRYLIRTARQALARGWITARMNLRNCGGTERLARTLYNAGQSDDAARVLDELDRRRFPRPLVAAGFSLGGNIVLRHAGLAGDGCLADAVAGVNPPIDLEHCARTIERPANRLYQAHYVRGLRRQLAGIRRVREIPEIGAEGGLLNTVRAFDASYTAPDAGYASAEAYYAGASAGPRLAGLRRPALILSARDDPFVSAEIFEGHRKLAGLRLLLPRAGGHCGFWQGGSPRYWAALALLDFFEEL